MFQLKSMTRHGPTNNKNFFVFMPNKNEKQEKEKQKTKTKKAKENNNNVTLSRDRMECVQSPGIKIENQSTEQMEKQKENEIRI